jgi:hypothetical protein
MQSDIQNNTSDGKGTAAKRGLSNPSFSQMLRRGKVRSARLGGYLRTSPMFASMIFSA